ncbi:hypothetical protein Acidovoranil_08370 [Acidovorax sp. FG27]
MTRPFFFDAAPVPRHQRGSQPSSIKKTARAKRAENGDPLQNHPDRAGPPPQQQPAGGLIYFAAQTVPDGLLMGTPTALPYSVHEPS